MLSPARSASVASILSLFSTPLMLQWTRNCLSYLPCHNIGKKSKGAKEREKNVQSVDYWHTKIVGVLHSK
jgi:hypothetical protein